jgi:hypothetical protein
MSSGGGADVGAVRRSAGGASRWSASRRCRSTVHVVPWRTLARRCCCCLCGAAVSDAACRVCSVRAPLLSSLPGESLCPASRSARRVALPERAARASASAACLRAVRAGPVCRLVSAHDPGVAPAGDERGSRRISVAASHRAEAEADVGRESASERALANTSCDTSSSTGCVSLPRRQRASCARRDTTARQRASRTRAARVRHCPPFGLAQAGCSAQRQSDVQSSPPSLST